jgi:hypothetical protein
MNNWHILGFKSNWLKSTFGHQNHSIEVDWGGRKVGWMDATGTFLLAKVPGGCILDNFEGKKNGRKKWRMIE